MAGQPLTIDSIPIAESEDDGQWQVDERGNDSTAILFGHTINNMTVGTLQLAGVDEFHSYFRFQDIPVDNPEHVLAAHMEFVAHSSDSGAIDITIQCVDEDDPSAPTTIEEILDWEYTTASVVWNPENFSAATTYQTVDFSSVIAEIVGRPGWVSGNSLIVAMRYLGSLQQNLRRRIRGFNHSTAPEPVLVLEWGEPSAPDPPTNPGGTVISATQINWFADAVDDADSYILQRRIKVE